MKLSKEDVDLYYKLHWSLLSYVKNKYRVAGGSIEPTLMRENPQKVMELKHLTKIGVKTRTEWEYIDIIKKLFLHNLT